MPDMSDFSVTILLHCRPAAGTNMPDMSRYARIEKGVGVPARASACPRAAVAGAVRVRVPRYVPLLPPSVAVRARSWCLWCDHTCGAHGRCMDTLGGSNGTMPRDMRGMGAHGARVAGHGGTLAHGCRDAGAQVGPCAVPLVVGHGCAGAWV